MAKLTNEQRRNIFSSLPVKSRAEVTGVAKRDEPMTKGDRMVYGAVDAARESAKTSYTTHKETEQAIVIPSAIPQTREESGLVDLSMQLDDSQLHALKVLHESEFACLMGAAGTGKTTLVKRSIANHIYGGDGFSKRGIRQLGNNKLTIAVCAFTGIATQVIKNTLPEWLHPCCMTIHTLLEFKPIEHVAVSEVQEEGSRKAGRFVPTRNAENPLDQNRIYIDEISMVGVDLWHMLLDACRPGTEIVLIGDLNQLTPVADVPFYPMALEAAAEERDGWALAELTTIHRQKGPGANRIIDTAHAILNGKRPEFDFELNAKGEPVDASGKAIADASPNPDWRVINIQVSADTDVAHRQMIQWLAQFEKIEIKSEGKRVYKPYEDLVLTAGNGWDMDKQGALVQQAQLNQTMSDVFVPETDEHPTYFIDAGRETRKYRVGDRVICTKNESPDIKNRVTNGMLGKIVHIVENGEWNGDRNRFGTKASVNEWRKRTFEKDHSGEYSLSDSMNSVLVDFAKHSTAASKEAPESEERQASHIVTIEYVNGETRKYKSAAGVASTQLGYAITVHKAQGSQAETVFVVCHGSVKGQLNREWLYTAVTRAQKRVVVFSTSMGLRTAVARQQIFGATLKEKIDRYVKNVNLAGKYVRMRPGIG